MDFDFIEKTELNNGMQSIFRCINNVGNYVAIELIVKVGSMLENSSVAGIAHLLEHVLMAFDKEMNFNKIYGKCSAYTDFYYTKYQFIVPANHIDICIQQIKDIMEGKYLCEVILKKARNDVIKEYLLDDQKEYFEQLFKDTPFHAKLAIGRFENIKRITLEDIKLFHKQWYSTKNSCIVVIGNENIKKNYNKNIETLLSIKQKCFKIPVVNDVFSSISYVNKILINSKRPFLKICFFCSYKYIEPEDYLKDNYEFAILNSVLKNGIENLLLLHEKRYQKVEISKYIISPAIELFEINIAGLRTDDQEQLFIINEIINTIKNIDESVILEEIDDTLIHIDNGYGFGSNLLNMLKECEENIVFSIPLISYDFAYKNMKKVFCSVTPNSVKSYLSRRQLMLKVIVGKSIGEKPILKSKMGEI